MSGLQVQWCLLLETIFAIIAKNVKRIIAIIAKLFDSRFAMAQKKSAGGMILPARATFLQRMYKSVAMYHGSQTGTTTNAVARRKIAPSLVSARWFPARVCVEGARRGGFPRDLDRQLDQSENTIPSGAGTSLTGQDSTGHDGPDRKHEEGTSPVNHRH
jgi:hypothetical protein